MDHVAEKIDVPQEDRPINLEESSSAELKREVVVEEVASTSTLAPVWTPKPHAPTDCRELLRQPFAGEHVL
jgi:hypothetical protein